VPKAPKTNPCYPKALAAIVDVAFVAMVMELAVSIAFRPRVSRLHEHSKKALARKTRPQTSR
jgi:hypothetical protein